MSEMHWDFSEDIPIPVVSAIYHNVLPEMKEWARDERVNWITDIEAMSVQQHENRRDWVLHVTTTDGERVHFMIRIGTLN